MNSTAKVRSIKRLSASLFRRVHGSCRATLAGARGEKVGGGMGWDGGGMGEGVVSCLLHSPEYTRL